MSGCALNSRAPRARAKLAILVVALGAAACGGGHSAPPGAEEPVLHIYNWADYIGQGTVAEFERRTHIKVVYEFYDSNDTLEAKMLAGHRATTSSAPPPDFTAARSRRALISRSTNRSCPTGRISIRPCLAIQAQADPGNRYAVPYLHAMNGFVYNVDLVKARMPDAPTDSLAMIFDPKVTAHFADCGITFLGFPEDVIQLALAYLHLDPNSRSIEDLHAAERAVMAVRPYIRTFDSNDYWHQLASKEVCLSIAWSSDYSVAQARAREDGTGAHLAFTLPKEGSNITYNALLIPASAPHPQAAHKFLNFILEPQVIAAITNDIHYGNDNLAARPFVKSDILERPGRLSAARIARAAVPPGRTRPGLRPAAHPGLDAHQDRTVARGRGADSATTTLWRR